MIKEADAIETMEMLPIEELVVLDTPSPTDNVVITEEPIAEPEKEFHPKTNKDMKKFLPYLKKLLTNVPVHSGKTTAGCERAIAHLDAADRLISQIVADDVDCVIDDQEVEALRKEIRKMKRSLKKRHKEINDAYDADDDKFAASQDAGIMKSADDKKWTCKKCDPNKDFGDEEHYTRHMVMEHGSAKADVGKTASSCACKVEKVAAVVDDGNCPSCHIKLWGAGDGIWECLACDEVYERQITKEAYSPKIQLVMNPFERAISGAIINGMVSGGRNAEDVYAELKAKYKFSDREELSIQQILTDMGYYSLKDRGHLGDKGGEQNSKGKSIEFATNYYA